LLNIQWFLADHLHSVVMNMRLFAEFPSHIIRTSGAFSIL
jgi:hypothetical protein